MDFVSSLLEKLDNPQRSLNLLHLVIQNWIVFQRNTFDYFDEDGDPYLSQIFFIDVSTGRYVHRAQGHKVDVGTTLDVNFLETKLTEAFYGTKACVGFPILDHVDTNGTSKLVDYPCKRQVSTSCQYFFQNPAFKLEAGDSREQCLSACPPCLTAWQEITSNPTQPVQESSQGGQVESVKNEEVDEDPGYFLDLDAASLLKESDDESLLPSDDDIWEPKSPETTSLATDIKQRPAAKRRRKRHREIKEESDELPEDGKTFKCKHCPEVFTSRQAHVSHMRKRKKVKRSKRQVGCPECKDAKDIYTFKQLVEHAMVKHPESVYEYEKYLQNPEEERRMLEPMTCFKCDGIANGSLMVFRHKEIYHDLGDYRCDECQEPCLTFYDLMIHNFKCHSKPTEHIQPNAAGLDTVIHMDGKVEVKRTKVMCPLCLTVYKRDCGLFNHLRTKHEWGRFSCEACEETCHYSKDISSHMINFHGHDPEVKCPNCNKMFSLKFDPDNFRNHYKECRVYDYQKRAIRSKQKSGPLQCHYCGKKYSVKQTLDAHIKMHQGIIRYRCSYCDYGSNHKAVVLDHEKTHLRKRGLTNEDTGVVLSYQCDQCGKQFAQRNSVARHVKVAHQGIRPSYPCKDCGEIFKHTVALYNHKKEKHGFVSTPVNRGSRAVVDDPMAGLNL
ncbi:hypothetical protein TCAL_12057 [Tigriopus californicus]|uniref:C2H2-type domain-containing protein n=1 Tax=Tigriopus californicus TaxID=6832 RepID=A0A553NE14_TIGCA|nr:zinc finger protein 184-like [Tigriopus californicus]TRY63645.1 hypothetical protein TCAL_12057 [Tigriopus californicus]|eukprot:TCALIF_12057-PA protein Name:"Similar to Znf879 Zinc finger protein 879 (Mus musculus)" AED:0.64 eAED:0.64 QI:0/-1/0/1/-1/1/1/0/667